MSLQEQVKQIVADTLQVDGEEWETDTALLGAIPEFDSMAVVNVITAIEENMGIFVEDDEISAETFETIGALTDFVKSKL